MDEINLLTSSSLLHLGATFPTRTDERNQSYEDITNSTRRSVKPDSLLSASQAYRSVMRAGMIDGLKKKKRERSWVGYETAEPEVRLCHGSDWCLCNPAH